MCRLPIGKVINDCMINEVQHAERNRHMSQPDDARIELIMKGPLAVHQEKGVDMSKIFSQLRAAQEAGMRRHGGIDMRPWWSLNQPRENPLIGKPWDLGKASVRKRA